MNGLARGITWPVITLIVIGTTHLVAELARPQLQSVFAPPVVMPIYLIAGAWTGFATLRASGSIAEAIGAAAALGLLPVGLQLVGFGVMLGRDSDSVVTAAAFGFIAILWGGLLGTGIGRSLAEPAADQTSEERKRNTGAAVA